MELSGLRLLLVDDDDDDGRDMMAHMLRMAGAEITTASSAQEALAAMAAAIPDLVVSDIGMPGEDGLALVRKLRLLDGEHGGRVPAVALTAYARGQDRASALRAGFNAHVAKPVESSEIIAVIASLCGRFLQPSRS